jgi:hypothetical protein
MSGLLEYDVHPLVARVEALLPLVTRLAQDASAAEWAFELALDASLPPGWEFTNEEYDEMAVKSGIRALHDDMSALACHAAAAVDFYLPDADRPAWFIVQQGRRRERRPQPDATTDG